MFKKAKCKCQNKILRVAVLYRVIQAWRSPIFERMNSLDGLTIKVFYGCDFPKTKVVTYKGEKKYPHKRLISIPFQLQFGDRHVLMPVSPSLFWELIKYKPNVILCEGASNLANDIIAYIYAIIFGVKTIQWGLGEIKNRKKSLLRRTMDFLIESMERYSNACLSYSTRGREYYKRIGVKSEKIFVAVNVVDTDKRIKKISNFDKKQIYIDAHKHVDFSILFVGALTKEKRIELLINAYKNFLKKTTVKSKLVIVGDGPDRSRLEKIAGNYFGEYIEFTGQVVEDVSRYFLAADLFVLPGLGGLAVSDAMVHGLPVIATIGDGCEKDLLSFGGGILDDDLDEFKLTQYLLQLSNDSTLLCKMREKAINTIADYYNISTYMQNMEKCIHYAYNN